MITFVTDIAKQNINALYSLSGLMHARGYWATDRSIEEDTANSVYELFHLLAWSDRNLHDNECTVLDAALHVDKFHGGHLAGLVLKDAPNGTFEPRVPGCLAAAALHDAVHGTRFGDMILQHLKNLALLILMADAKVKSLEAEAYDAYFLRLRRSISTGPMCPE